MEKTAADRPEPTAGSGRDFSAHSDPRLQVSSEAVCPGRLHLAALRASRGRTGKSQSAIAVAVLDDESLPPDIPAGTHASRFVAALRRTRPEVERLLIANNVPPVDGYELLLTALGNVPESLEGVRLDRSLLQEVHRSLSFRRDQHRLWMRQVRAWIDLLVQAGIVPRTERAAWLFTLGTQKL